MHAAGLKNHLQRKQERWRQESQGDEGLLGYKTVLKRKQKVMAHTRP